MVRNTELSIAKDFLLNPYVLGQNSLILVTLYGWSWVDMFIYIRVGDWSTLEPFSQVIFDDRATKKRWSLWSSSVMAGRFAAIQSCPGTWLEKLKDPYLPILNIYVHIYICDRSYRAIIVRKNMVFTKAWRRSKSRNEETKRDPGFT